jgi:tripartite-type tricarboxylate transporter receptor subunit TctC
MAQVRIRPYAALVASHLLVSCAFAQSAPAYPSKPVRWVVAFAAGGPVDVLSRAVAEKLAQRWGQPVIIDNRSGAGGTLGADLAAKAAPDGYTLMTGHVGTHAINATLYRNLPYDPVRDFTPVTLIAYMPFVLLTHPAVPANNAKELIALAKARPGQLNYASAGNGGPTHLIPELFKTMAGINIVHVSYKGNTAALTDLVAGQVQMMFSNLLTSMPFVRIGKLRAIGISTAKRSSQVPLLPSIAESGLPGFDVKAWYGVLAPAGLPKSLLARLNAEIAQTLALPDMQARFVPQGIDLASSTSEHFAELIESEVVRWRKIVNDAGAVPE